LSGFRGMALGGGFEGDAVAEGFELSDVVALLGVGVDVSVVVVGAELVESGVGVGEQVPDDHLHGLLIWIVIDSHRPLNPTGEPSQAGMAWKRSGVRIP
jgi:hypothetical protein